MKTDWQPAADLFRDRIILVTGAGAGIGRATALALARHGTTVILLGKTQSRLEAVYDEIEQMGAPQPALFPLDLESATPEAYEGLAITLEREFGRLDGLLHNAALLGYLAPIGHYDPEHWQKVVQVNLNAPFMLSRACLGLLMKAEDPSLVFMSDAVGREARAYWGAYGAAKAGLENLMETLASELETNTPIRVNSYDPGPAHTRLRLQAFPAEDSSQLPRPEDVVDPLLYLLGPDSRGVTGQRFSRSDFTGSAQGGEAR
ncbi:YciK family oxidoreductase [Thiohalobacter sp. IOR34]|uniref:YciK family oxidoreductase n=1 Tax=Thiohalobacter sp. IOR34 TaxID=3057176 RepID=UPI0025B2386A|nr:YciK family oxidoreductase [Thiohalobacter sp. IOR34]WJW76654.1 YciK family oxidoreductase [Thiohalobacter sp. IOR34]